MKWTQKIILYLYLYSMVMIVQHDQIIFVNPHLRNYSWQNERKW